MLNIFAAKGTTISPQLISRIKHAISETPVSRWDGRSTFDQPSGKTCLYSELNIPFNGDDILTLVHSRTTSTLYDFRLPNHTTVEIFEVLQSRSGDSQKTLLSDAKDAELLVKEAENRAYTFKHEVEHKINTVAADIVTGERPVTWHECNSQWRGGRRFDAKSGEYTFSLEFHTSWVLLFPYKIYSLSGTVDTNLGEITSTTSGDGVRNLFKKVEQQSYH